MKGSHHVLTTKSTVFIVSKDEWNTKKDAGKSMKNTLYILLYAERHRVKQHQQLKNQAHSIKLQLRHKAVS